MPSLGARGQDAAAAARWDGSSPLYTHPIEQNRVGVLCAQTLGFERLRRGRAASAWCLGEREDRSQENLTEKGRCAGANGQHAVSDPDKLSG